MTPKTIVVIDDENDVTVFMETALEDAGYVALSAADSAEGLALIRKVRPDLVCLDILMPGETGITLYQRLKQDDELKDIPVIITSGLSLKKDLKNINYRLLPDGKRLPEPEGIVEKPIAIDEFLETVHRIIG
jgi:two-component system, OmpR family, phosphate regulon response regulator PhoB